MSLLGFCLERQQHLPYVCVSLMPSVTKRDKETSSRRVAVLYSFVIIDADCAIGMLPAVVADADYSYLILLVLQWHLPKG